MGVYIPGAFKKALVSTKEEIVPVDKVKEEKIEYIVKPVENIKQVVWVKNNNEDKREVVKLDDIKPIKYLRRDTYLRRRNYREFLDNEWDNLNHIYDCLINYDERLLDKMRVSEDDKGFYDLTKIIYSNLKKYE